jgi:MFS family permease
MTLAIEMTDAHRRRNLFAACAAVIVFGFALGLTYPLLSLVLESRGVSASMIGLNAAMAPIGIVAFSVFIPVLARRWGTRNVAMTAAFLTACVLLSYKVFPSIEAWFVLRLVQGMVVSTLFVLSENDTIVSTPDCIAIAEDLDPASAAVEVAVLPGADHGFDQRESVRGRGAAVLSKNL